jgi:DNA-binding NtrC family response regulator
MNYTDVEGIMYMKTTYSIIKSHDTEIITLCEDIGSEIGMKVASKPDLANFLLELQENDYQVAIFDCTNMDFNCIKWVKVVRRIRPKIPLIIISDKVDQRTGGKVYEEGTFYLCILPVQKELLRDVLCAAIASYGLKKSGQYKGREKTGLG